MPLINGGIMFCHPASNSIPIKNLISGKTTKIKSSCSLNLKRLFRKYSFFNYFLKKRLEINLLKKENLLGYKMQKPFLATSNFKYLNYFTGSIDKNIFKFTNSTFLKKIEVNRCKTLEMINEYFINNNNFRIYENKNFKNDYGIPYGILIDIDKVESKNKIEEELLKPLINQIKNVDVILWPYNAMEKFEISGIELKSKLLILPRI